jgi:ABC-2 type transport system ATP-binding protein
MAGDVNVVLTNEDFIEVGVDAAATGRLQELLSSLTHVRLVKATEGFLQVFFEKESMDPGELNRVCFERGITLNHLQLRKRSLESKFMELTDERATPKK